MNILFLTYQGDMAGSTRSIFYLSSGLAEKGHNVYVGCRQDSLLYQLLENSKVERVPMEFKGRLDLNNMKAIRDVVYDKKIETINAQSSYDRYTSILAKWRYKLDVKLVHTRRQKPRSDGGWIQRQFYIRGTDKIVVVSEELKRMFIEKGYPASHVEAIYNGVPQNIIELIDPVKVGSIKRELGIRENDIVIGCISRKKSQDELIRALKHLDPSWKILFVGIDKEFLQDVIAEEDPKQEIIFAGKLKFEESLQYYKLLDVNILPSRMDGFGLVIIESMMLGTPVIGADKGGILDLIEDGKSGLIYRFGDPYDLAKKINSLMDNPSWRNDIVLKGAERAKEFTIERTISNYESFFEELLLQ